MSNALVKKTTTITLSPEAKRERNRRKRQRKAAKRATGQRVQTVERIIQQQPPLGQRAAAYRVQNGGAAVGGVKAAIAKLENRVRSDERKLATTVERVFETIALPQSESAVRLSTGGTARGTMLAQAVADFDVPWQNTNSSSGNRYYFDPSDTALIVFGDVRRGYIYYNPNSTSQTWSYSVNYHNSSGTANGTASFFRMNTEDYPLIAYATPNNTYKPHGSFLWPGKNREGTHLIWIDSPDGATTATFTGLPASAYTLRAIKWQAGETEETVVVNASTSTLVYNVAESGYYNFAVDDATGALINQISLTIAGTCSNMCHLEAQDFYLNRSKIDAAAVISFSGMYTNKAGKDAIGEIVGAQLDGANNWMSAIGLSGVPGQFAPGTAQSNIKNLPSHMWDKQVTSNGFYAFKKPNSVKEFRQKQLVENPNMGSTFGSNSQFAVPYDLDTNDPYLVILPHCPIPAGNSFFVQSGDFVVNWCIEYSTFNSWDCPEHNLVKPTDLEDIVSAMQRAPQFHENPLHFGDIISFVRQRILPVASSIMGSLAAVVPPQAKPFMLAGSMAADMFSQERKSKPKARPRTFKKMGYARP